MKFSGGILIRSIREIINGKPGEYIHGPSKVVDTILKLFNRTSVKELIENEFDNIIDITKNQYFSLYSINKDSFVISQFKYLDVTCPVIEFKKNTIIKEIKNLNPDISRSHILSLESVSNKLDKSNSEVKKLIPIVHDLMGLSNVLPEEKSRYIMCICFNILTRAALTGNIDAMYDITNIAFTPTEKEVAKIFSIKDIENLDYKQVKKALAQKLEENKRETAFIEVLEEIKQVSQRRKRRRFDIDSVLDTEIGINSKIKPLNWGKKEKDLNSKNKNKLTKTNLKSIQNQRNEVNLKKEVIYQTPRVGLTPHPGNSEKELNKEYYYLIRNYRYIIYPNMIKKGKVQLIISLYLSNINIHRIEEITATKKLVIEKYLLDYEKGKKMKLKQLNIKKIEDLCRLYGFIYHQLH